MQSATKMVDQHRQQNDILADIQKQAQLVSDMAWSATTAKTGSEYKEILTGLKQQQSKLQQLFNQI